MTACLVTLKYKPDFQKDLATWDTGDELDHHSLKGNFAEFAAVLGPSISTEIIVDLA